MTREEIIRMAMGVDGHMNDHRGGIDLSWGSLVQIVQTAIAAEREACAMVCDELVENRPMTGAGKLIAQEAAVAIRARGDKC